MRCCQGRYFRRAVLTRLACSLACVHANCEFLMRPRSAAHVEDGGHAAMHTRWASTLERNNSKVHSAFPLSQKARAFCKFLLNSWRQTVESGLASPSACWKTWSDRSLLFSSSSSMSARPLKLLMKQTLKTLCIFPTSPSTFSESAHFCQSARHRTFT